MKILKHAVAALTGLGMLAAASSSLAIPTLSYTTTNYGAFSHDPFDGFDWNSAGSAVTSGFVPDGTTVFTTEFWSDAVTIKRLGGGTFASALTAAGTANGAEFTIQAFINETAVPLTATTSAFTAVGGSYNIWYQPLSNANLVTGAGITDGTLVLSGSILPGFAGTFTALPVGGGTGIFTFLGNVTSTNAAFINPDLIDTEAVSTIQFGSSTTSWTQPTSTPSGAIGPGDLIFQADANQSFTAAVPYPMTTTSSISKASGCMTTSKVVSPLTGSFWVE